MNNFRKLLKTEDLASCSKSVCSPLMMYLNYDSSIISLSGGEARLPCDLVPSQPGDSVYLVLWYKKNGKTPIFSYDSRAGAPEQWSEPSVFGERARFIDYAGPGSALKIVDVSKLHDEGKLNLDINIMKDLLLEVNLTLQPQFCIKTN